MATDVEIDSYQELMFGHFNTPAALDDLLDLVDWNEIYSAVQLPAAALLAPDAAEEDGELFDRGLYAIFGARRNARGWKIRGIFYCACADGFEAQLSRGCDVLTFESGSAPVNVKFYGEDCDKYVALYGFPTQDNLNGLFSGNREPYDSSEMVGRARRATRQIVAGMSLRNALIGNAEGSMRSNLERQAAILKHIRPWYRAYRRNQALFQHRLAHGEATKHLVSLPTIREAVALANRELGIEKARIRRSERFL